ncbi:MAG: hypothetical protein IAE86_06120 [Burkholderiaceae bacterium]|nr:hypothetical protein [Burkholderiaceae bacterium]
MFFDHGQLLGFAANTEARIDLIAQAWSVRSGQAPLARQAQALAAVQTHLVAKNVGLIRLPDPPLAHAQFSAGYIRVFAAGVHEKRRPVLACPRLGGDGPARACQGAARPWGRGRTWPGVSLKTSTPPTATDSPRRLRPTASTPRRGSAMSTRCRLEWGGVAGTGTPARAGCIVRIRVDLRFAKSAQPS